MDVVPGHFWGRGAFRRGRSSKSTLWRCIVCAGLVHSWSNTIFLMVKWPISEVCDDMIDMIDMGLKILGNIPKSSGWIIIFFRESLWKWLASHSDMPFYLTTLDFDSRLKHDFWIWSGLGMSPQVHWQWSSRTGERTSESWKRGWKGWLAVGQRC